MAKFIRIIPKKLEGYWSDMDPSFLSAMMHSIIKQVTWNRRTGVYKKNAILNFMEAQNYKCMSGKNLTVSSYSQATTFN